MADRFRPLERVAAQSINIRGVSADTGRNQQQPGRRAHAIARRRLDAPKGDPRQRRQDQDAVGARRRRERTGDAADHHGRVRNP